MNKKVVKNSNGITLVALVVTIIVLIILAGVSINLVLGENGIITKAQEARRLQEIAQIKENINMEIVAKELEKVENKEILTHEDVGEILAKYGTVNKNHDWTIKSLTPTGKDYEISLEEIYTKELPEPLPIVAETPDKSNKIAFDRMYGVIEIQFLEGTSYKTTTIPNEPNLGKNMKKVYWEEYKEEEQTKVREVLEGTEGFDNTKWYSYISQTGNTQNGGTSKWANAVTVDDSGNITGYFVWIPRYAYRIIYFDTQEHEDAYRLTGATDGIIGYSDARGFVHPDGSTPSDMEEPITSIYVGANKLRPHPAFEDGSNTSYTQGEWNKALEGIWIAKYETSGSLENMKVLPGMQAVWYTSIGYGYTCSLNFSQANNSHMIKNSEWGAMAYLADSKYGRNGTTITINSEGQYTGGTSEIILPSNPLQSTTGNIYGIYDISGGSFEYVAGYIADNSNNHGNSFASTNPENAEGKNDKIISTPYATVYAMGTEGVNSINVENYKANINKKFGDSIIETSSRTFRVWNLEHSNFVGMDNGNNYNSFFLRSGYYLNNDAGIFSADVNSGNGSYAISSHLVLCVQ